MASSALLVGKGAAAGSTVTTAAGTTSASGSGFVVFFAYAGASVTSVTDSKGNVYTKRGALQNLIECWAALPGDAGYVGGGASHTATVNFSASAAASLHLIEATSLLTTGSFDQVVGTVDATSPWEVTTGTLGQADSVALSGFERNTTNPASYTAGGGFTLLSSETDWNNFYTSAVSGVVVSSTAARTPSWTTGTGGNDSGGVLCLVLKSSTTPPPASVKPAWAGVYGRGGGRDLVRAHGLTITSKNLGSTFVNALFGAPAAGGPGAVSETFSLTDTPNANASMGVARAEAAALVETTNATKITTGAIVEAVSLSDSSNALFAVAGSVAEAFTLADSQASTFVGAGTVSEAVTLSDTQSVLALFVGAVSESVALSDTQDGSTTGAATGDVQEAIALSDTPNASGVFAVIRSEAATLAETQAATYVTLGAVVEAFALADTQDATAGPQIINVTVSEAFSLVDTQSLPVEEAPIRGGGIPRFFKFNRETDEERDKRHAEMFAPKLQLEKVQKRLVKVRDVEAEARNALKLAQQALREAKSRAEKLALDKERKAAASMADQYAREANLLRKESARIQIQIAQLERDTEEADIAFIVSLLAEL